MLEKMKSVSNPLTVIALFAALSDVAATSAMGFMDHAIQQTFVWFVMLFPVLLVVLFFATLVLKPDVLYAPSDFKDESNYMVLREGTSRIALRLREVEAKLSIETEEQLVEDARGEPIKEKIIGDKYPGSSLNVSEINREVMESISSILSDVEKLKAKSGPQRVVRSTLDDRIFEMLDAIGATSAEVLARMLSESRANIDLAIDRLVESKIVVVTTHSHSGRTIRLAL
jgi:biotin operon repressor